MIVLWGVPGDRPLDAVSEALSALGTPFRLLDQREAHACEARVELNGGRFDLWLLESTSSSSLDFASVRAAYLRPIETAQALPSALHGDPARELRADATDRALITWADLTDALVINPPFAMAPNNSKPYQLRLIAAGFDVPDTLVTTDPAAVRAFAAKHGRIIYKSVSGVRSIVNVLGTEELARLDDVANAPTQFQQYVAGVDVRVHVVGSEIYATEVRSSAHDYRYASPAEGDVELGPLELPAELAQRCQQMAARMGLHVAGIDLRRTAEGRWVCFEVNPSPAFVYYEAATGQPIANAIARLLSRAGQGEARKGQPRRSERVHPSSGGPAV
jgi:hypothetical protein